MAQCKLNKISIVCEKWKRRGIPSDNAMQEIQHILQLKESEMPPCNCDDNAKETTAASCPMPPRETTAAPSSRSCHTPGPMTINPFFNFMKEIRETTCFNKSATEVSKEAGSRWSKMSDCDKAKYIVEAYKVSRKKDGYSPKREHSSSSMSEPKSKIRKGN